MEFKYKNYAFPPPLEKNCYPVVTWSYTCILNQQWQEWIALVMWILTAEGRIPPSAVYKESFPTGIPIPCQHFINWHLSCERERERERDEEVKDQ